MKHLLDSVPVSPVYGLDGVLEESISEFPYFALDLLLSQNKTVESPSEEFNNIGQYDLPHCAAENGDTNSN